MSCFYSFQPIEIKHLTSEFLDKFNYGQAGCNKLIFTFEKKSKKLHIVIELKNNRAIVHFMKKGWVNNKMIFKNPKIEINDEKLFILSLNPTPSRLEIMSNYLLTSFQLIKKN